MLEELKPSDGDVERMRTLQNARYAALLLAIWPEAQKGNLAAIDRAEKLMRGINVINGINKSPSGLPGGESENPMWISMSELARRLPYNNEVAEPDASALDAQLDRELDEMYSEVDLR